MVKAAIVMFLTPGQYWLVVHSDFSNAKLD
jgi:hypothetical protein